MAVHKSENNVHSSTVPFLSVMFLNSNVAIYCRKDFKFVDFCVKVFLATRRGIKGNVPVRKG